MLVGRKSERAAIDALVEGAERGQGGALLVTGEPGIGKTTLLDDAVERLATDGTVLRASGRESDVDLPFAGLASLLLPAERQFRALPRPQSSALRRALGLDEAEDAVDRLSVGVATLGVLAGLAGQRPVLIVVDDLQWVDEPSSATILFAARRLAPLPVALLLAAREGELPESETRGLPHLELAGLRGRDGGTLLASVARVPLDAAVRRRLLEFSQGNPLALVELPASLSNAQLAGDDPLGEPIPVNGGIERAFGTRIARLPEQTRSALLIAAAAGSDVGEAIAAAFRQRGLDLSDLEPAELDGLVVVSSGRVAFRHPLVRSVVYHGQSEEARRMVHGTLAEVEQDPDRRAWHLYAAAEDASEPSLASWMPPRSARLLAEPPPLPREHSRLRPSSRRTRSQGTTADRCGSSRPSSR